ncbi:hypothetical protein CATRI_09825 [Corynebacterium atrinae]|uniref:hypothetical protein n=1 Tax=Corynebacterium atrinae TaxID=1336740 RepID=UPI0025B4BAD6|nr:hypothetical protein [Corynebacterium atrinae]WJY64033.1 hypothetical protein CATRI_09825 [Corynebacterium atrinae]
MKSTWLIRISIGFPAGIDPEVRADRLSRVRDYVQSWPTAAVWQVVGGLDLVAVVTAADPQVLLAGMPAGSWLDVSVEAMVGL